MENKSDMLNAELLCTIRGIESIESISATYDIALNLFENEINNYWDDEMPIIKFSEFDEDTNDKDFISKFYKFIKSTIVVEDFINRAIRTDKNTCFWSDEQSIYSAFDMAVRYKTGTIKYMTFKSIKNDFKNGVDLTE